MIKIIDFILSVLFWLYFCLSSVVLYFICLITYCSTCLFDKKLAILHFITSLWAYHYVLMNFWVKVQFINRKNLIKNQPHILVSNHQSAADIFICYGLFHTFKWVSKESLFKIPFIGWNMVLNKYIKLFRTNPRSIIAMLNQCADYIKRGISIFIFPEGTRSKDNNVHSFKTGAFKIAFKNNTTVSPVVINGLHDNFSVNSWIFPFTKKKKIRVEVLPAQNPQNFSDANRFTQHIEEMIRKKFDKYKITTKN